MIHIFGIRHHGAGSARNLIHALEEVNPDVLLIECPSDTQSMIKFIDFEEMLPPVALLVYEISDLSQFAYYPFTVFSPEWQALRFADIHQVPVRFIDLPFSLNSGFPESKSKDPFVILASSAGYHDTERWWESTFELPQMNRPPFEIIMDLMKVIRNDAEETDPLMLAREAYMRNEIRKAILEEFKSIAVVCGAWHAPALVDLDRPDLPGKPSSISGSKRKTGCTWVPWSYYNISKASGYGAGVISPYWYEALFFHGPEAVHHWLSRAAGILRIHEVPVSPAELIESSRLAHTLAVMRDQPLPGIDELFDAVISVCTKGDDAILSLLTEKILTGEGIGFVPTTVPGIPLQQDIQRHLKALRLFSFWRSPGSFEKKLDLRKKSHQRMSVFFHRLNLLGISWASEQLPEGNPLGAFSEFWTLEWQPDFPLIIIDKSRWGNTLKEAVIACTKDLLKDVNTLSGLGSLLFSALRANVSETILPIINRIRDIGHLTKEVLPLLGTFPDLVRSHRYGFGMEFLRVQIGDLIRDLYPRMCILLPDSTRHINDETAEQFYSSFVAVHHAVHLMEIQDSGTFWYDALDKIIYNPHTHPLISGVSLKFLFGKGRLSVNQVIGKLRYELSQLSEITRGSQFLEGFLSESGWWLIHLPFLREAVDEWICHWADEHFLQYLPVLRRIFSKYSKAEKEVLIELSKDQTLHVHQKQPELDPGREQFFTGTLERLYSPDSDRG